MQTNKGYICDAEIGRPCALHGCNRKAHYITRGRFGITLHYCEHHKDRRPDPQPLRPDNLSNGW